MIFLHILDDFCLQGILASMKQKEWWRKQEGYKEIYKYDYIIALLMHAFSWTFVVMLPIMISLQGNLTIMFRGVFIANLIIHAVVDDLKANKKKINLATDQAVHLIQIVVTALILV